jgi:hypothetical protein
MILYTKYVSFKLNKKFKYEVKYDFPIYFISL